jgi:hypothetical protein
MVDSSFLVADDRPRRTPLSRPPSTINYQRSTKGAKDRVFYGRERIVCEKTGPLSRPLVEK